MIVNMLVGAPLCGFSNAGYKHGGQNISGQSLADGVVFGGYLSRLVQSACHEFGDSVHPW